MIVERIVADALSENCYLLAGSGTSVVVDPGSGTAWAIRDLHERHGLTLGCVLLTHAHPDHVWDAAEVAGEAPVYVPAPDRPRLEDPLGGTTPELLAVLGLDGWHRPANVRELGSAFFEGGGAELVPGVAVRAVPAPGHTEGSSVYLLSGTWPAHVAGWVGATPSDEPQPLALTGDVVFRGSVGRTDLPGGEANVMAWSLRTLRQVVDPRTWILPGHGPGSTWRHELATNPFLAARR
ncbi:MAG: MBL fold metallo-hydrolase [Actinomycetota bacterium]